MQKVIFFAPFYEGIVEEYRAELYIKGRVNIRKQNRILRFLPSMFRLRKGVKEYMVETYSDLHFTAPDIYDQKVKASVGTASELWEVDGHLPEYFHINVYASTLLNDKLLSPLSANARKYYAYRVDSVMGDVRERHYKISFTPRSKSYQLVEGYMVVSDNVWSLRELRFKGSSEMVTFDNHVRMGKVGSADEFLPQEYDVDAGFRFLGNRMDGVYKAVLKYQNIKQAEPDKVADYRRRNHLGKRKSKYDLSDSYTLTADTNAYRVDTAYFNTLRPIPLNAQERQLYQDFFLRRDTLGRVEQPKSKSRVFWGKLGDALISRHTIDLASMGDVRTSPLINPLLLSYSGSRGLSYRQELRYNRLFPGDRLLRIVPRIGYNFKEKIFYWQAALDFDYWPRRRTALHLEFGNDNRIYSSDVLDELKEIPDSIFDFDHIHLDYFNDLYLKMHHSWEIVNGLTLDVGLSMHRREAVKASQLVPLSGKIIEEESGFGGWLQRYRPVYNSFAPRMRLTWTPGQYYYMNGRRKVNLHSHYPTFSIDWERGIKGVFPNSGEYERMELDVQYVLPLGPMRDLYLRAGWGAFTNQKELFFVDFANLRRSNLPLGWNDDIGGVFQLLDGRWYNSSRKYLRAHATYEAPFLLLHALNKNAKYVLNERLYLNALVVPHLKPYLEVGYGIGTHIFDFGVFAGFANWKYREVGCKFTFELFNR